METWKLDRWLYFFVCCFHSDCLEHSFWSVKYLNFGQQLPIWTPHHTFLESWHPEVTKNPYYILSPEGRQKKKYYEILNNIHLEAVQDIFTGKSTDKWLVKQKNDQ